MATLCHLSSFFACNPLKHRASHRSLSFQLHDPFLELQTRQCSSSFPNKSLVSACSVKKPRIRKKAKSNEEICNEIREFISMVGFPQGHVPSFKELSQHGRQDLAYIVRRRGYKLIKELLMYTSNVESNMEISSCENQNDTDLCESETGLCEKVNESDAGGPLLESRDENQNCVPVVNAAVQIWGSGESSTVSSLQEKAANFIQNGELDTIEIEDMELLTESHMGHSILSRSATDKGKTCGMENNLGVQPTASIEESSEKANGSSVTSVSSGSTMKSQGAPPTAETDLHRTDLLPTEGLKDSGLDVEDNEVEINGLNVLRDDEAEVNSLNVFLHQKQLELTLLKEQIEKDQRALSILQIKANTDISKAQKFVSEKEAELQAAEESLLGLKEVEVEYWVFGDTVEMAGSFNGWDHRITMELHSSSSLLYSPKSRYYGYQAESLKPLLWQSRLWSTVLWLYPGVYEIKFIVDGYWMIDPGRECTTVGNITNNILRVDR